MITKPGDLLLVHHKKEPVSYARVEEISADLKPGWWQIRLLLLQVPRREVTWILREEYIDGGEFTMGGDPMHLELLPPPQPLQAPEPEPEEEEREDKGGEAKVVSLAKRRKKKS